MMNESLAPQLKEKSSKSVPYVMTAAAGTSPFIIYLVINWLTRNESD